MNDIVISLTSHGDRIKQCARTIFSIIQNTVKTRIVLTVYKDDIEQVNTAEDLKCLIDNNIVELIVAEKDLGPHLKYFYTMKKYNDFDIITIDDDIIYEPNMIKKLLEFNLKFPNKIIANRCHFIKTLDYNKWDKEIKTHTSSHKNFGTGVGGIFYPKNCFKLDNDNIQEILKIKYADDIYLKILELRNNIEVVNSYNLNFKTLRDDIIEQTALYKVNISNNRNNVYLKNFSSDFKSII